MGRGLRRFFRPQLEGWESLPEEGPFLMVANHSGGGLIDVLALPYLWEERFKGARPVTAMAHPLLFYIEPLRTLVRHTGAIPATYEAALDAFKKNIPVLVFPGGDHDAFRPIWKAGEVSFAGRKGFLRLARRANVPIVPIAIDGTHYTMPIFWRSKLLAWLLGPRLLGVKRYPLTLLGVIGGGVAWSQRHRLGPRRALSYAWLWLIIAAFLPALPWPVKMQIGAPLSPQRLFELEGDEGLSAAYAQVEAAVQDLLTGLRSAKKY